MVLVVLTDKDPFAAIESIIRRGAYILIPLSIIVVKYFRNIGVQYDWSGTGVSWCGLSTSKNTLGQVVMISALCFAWSIFRDFRRNQPGAIFNYIYLAMSLYLLKGSEKSISVTSLSVFVMGLLLLATSYRNRLNFRYLARLLTAACITIFCVQVILLVHTSDPFAKDSFLGLLIRGLGRDMTLSGRTGIWSDVLTIAARSPLLGVGSGGFWIGRAANIPWDAHLTWVLGEGHNGYFDVYLQIGLIGVFLLLGIILSARRGITRTFKDDFEYGMFRMTFLIIILFVNITESTFLRGEHLLWFMFLFCVISVPAMHRDDLQTDPVGISGEAVAAEFT
jgi:O-antigen ligase